MKHAGARGIRWTEGFLMRQDLTEILVYFNGEDNGDGDEIPEMDTDLIFEG